MNTVMKIKDLTCTLNTPDALKTKKDADGNEIMHSLPPYAPRKAYVVDEYPACPDNWMHGSDKAASYFVPVEAGKGMWLDFNDGCWAHKYHVAIVLSIQGINPISGQKQTGFGLEQYKKKCPVHDVDFKTDRYCPKCEYKWPAQNYLTTTATPHGELWLDGFRGPDGKVQQYLFTEDTLKGIAAQIIGKDRVYALGIAFYLSEKEKPQPEPRRRSRYGSSGPYTKSVDIWESKGSKAEWIYKPTYTPNDSVVPISSQNFCVTASLDGMEDSSRGMLRSASVNKVEVSKQLEVGAGAAIGQSIHEDVEDLSFWRESPEGFLYVNYVIQEDADKIIKAGKRQDKEKGFMDGLNVGN